MEIGVVGLIAQSVAGVGAIYFRKSESLVQFVILATSIVALFFIGFGIAELRSTLVLRLCVYFSIAVQAYLIVNILKPSDNSHRRIVLVALFVMAWFYYELAWIPRWVAAPYVRDRFEERSKLNAESNELLNEKAR